MTVNHIVDTASLSVGGLARANPVIEALRYLLSQELRGETLIRGNLWKAAIGFRQLVYVIS